MTRFLSIGAAVLNASGTPQTARPRIMISAGPGKGGVNGSMPDRECNLTRWISSQEVECVTPPGWGAGLQLRIIDMGGQKSNALTWRYDAAVVKTVTPSTGSPKGGYDVTLTGFNFGPPGASPVAAINGVDCAKTKHLNGSHVVCTMSPGVGGNLVPFVHHGDVWSSPQTPAKFSFHLPSITSLSVVHGPAAGGTNITITGTNFGAAALPPTGKGGYVHEKLPKLTVKVAEANCAPTVWLSATSLSCTVAPGSGVGVNRSVSVTVGGQTASTRPCNSSSMTGDACLKQQWSFDPPSVASIEPTAIPGKGGQWELKEESWVTKREVDGEYLLQPAGERQTGQKPPFVCEPQTPECAARWSVESVSGSSCVKRVRGVCFRTRYSIARSNYRMKWTWVPSVVQILGKNFGSRMFSNSALKASVGSQTCESVNVVNDGLMRCTLSSKEDQMIETGAGLPRPLWVSVGGQLSSKRKYDQAEGSIANPALFAANHYALKAGGTCLEQGAGRRSCSAFELLNSTATAESVCCSDAALTLLPVVGSVKKDTKVTATLRVNGANFGDPSLVGGGAPTVSIGGVACSNSTWVSPTVLDCVVAAEQESSKAAMVTVSMKSHLPGANATLTGSVPDLEGVSSTGKKCPAREPVLESWYTTVGPAPPVPVASNATASSEGATGAAGGATGAAGEAAVSAPSFRAVRSRR